MSESPVLIEPSFADAIAMIAAAEELSGQTRRHWATSLRSVARFFDKPLEIIPARYSAVRADLAQLHAAPLGLSPKTLQNHKSNVKSALLWLTREKGIPAHGTPLTAAWEALRSKVSDALIRMRLASLMRFCSANGIEPAAVDEAVIDGFIGYRVRAGKRVADAFRRLVARAWNGNVGVVPGWPAVQLLEPAIKPAVEVAWEEFPAGLREAVDQVP
jgi:hypothetical protein